jgi:hypothetical protein
MILPSVFSFRKTVLIAASLGLGMFAGCVSNRTLTNVPLTWSPSDTLDLGGVRQNFGAPATLHFLPFEDTAPDPQLIGKNVEPDRIHHWDPGTGRDKPLPVDVTTSDQVGRFVSQHMQDLFAQAGYRAADTNAERVVSGVVHKFFVEEGSLYRATLDLSLTVRDQNGKVLWSGTVQGTSSTFGRSYSLENYEQVLSDSVMDAVDQLLQNSPFNKALAVPAR